ncbi:MAG: hypothetical protein JXD19_01020 [Deltaproteobacteria bacterium]|nr:hypothetical protein [Deltaproteobacteria bacterium]
MACEHSSKKTLQKKVIQVDEEPGAYCGTLTKTTYEITYKCKDCGEEWKETKEETKFE